MKNILFKINKHHVRTCIFTLLLFSYFAASLLFQYDQSMERVHDTLLFGSWIQVSITLIAAFGVLLQVPFLAPIIFAMVVWSPVYNDFSYYLLPDIFVIGSLIFALGYSYYFLELLPKVRSYFKGKKILSGTLCFLILLPFVSAVITAVGYRYIFAKQEIPLPIFTSKLSADEIKQFHKPDMKIEKGRYVHEVLRFSLPVFYASGLRDESNFGKIRQIRWPDKDIKITAGYFYDKQGHLLNIQEVARAHLRPDEKKELQLFNFDPFMPAVRLDMTAADINIKLFSPYSIAVIQKGPVVYELYAPSAAALDELLRQFKFTDDRIPTEAELVGTVSVTGVKNEARLFFPTPNTTINATWSTITGKLRQGTTEFLTSSFALSAPPYTPNDPGFYLTYTPGRVINTSFFLDGERTNVFGFPQYPTVNCSIGLPNHDGSSQVDDFLYGGSRNIEPLRTKEECLGRKADSLPPVIFFLKPEHLLAPGSHTLKIIFQNGETQAFSFTVDPTSIHSAQTIPQKIELDDIDNCMRGYYYDGSYFHIPLPKIDNPNLLFRLSFPQSDAERGSIQRRGVYIKFEGKLFDLQFPQSSLFYFSDELDRFPDKDSPGKIQTQVNPYRALYIPTKNLFYSNGMPATIWIKDVYDSSEYIELFPVDSLGQPYRKSIPWETSGSSGCDG